MYCDQWVEINFVLDWEYVYHPNWKHVSWIVYTSLIWVIEFSFAYVYPSIYNGWYVVWLMLFSIVKQDSFNCKYTFYKMIRSCNLAKWTGKMILGNYSW